ncbi:S41 family peptidase [Kocuria sp.]|uniref:S41 family peptidase n=1 Tax=Kocuria sp. TaxID=1871328 RepID=UPI0026DD81C8|nr:S41 family peptidase [Kocuria sp.]MDO4918962.1 S41 family peptidase [Kocuria sp.]
MTLSGIAPDGLFHIDFPVDWLGPDVLSLLAQERHEFEAVLGVPVVFSEPAGTCCRWVVERADPGEAPSLEWNAERGVLVSRAADGQGVMATLSLLQTLAHSPGTQVSAAPPSTIDEAIELIRTECATTYPYFTLRGLRWDDICAGALQDRPRTWDQFIPWATRWVAQLGDAHTAVIDHRSAEFHPPYTAELLERGAVMIRVPEESAAFAAGVRPGWIVDVGDPAAWLAAVGASPQQHGRMAARRAMAIQGTQRRFTARDPRSSRSVTWTEEAGRHSRDDIVRLERSRSGEVHIVLRAFDPSADVESVFDAAAAAATASDRMVLDLRGNVGGDIMLAGRLRDRFLRARTWVGSAAFTDGRGGLSEPRPRWADPSESGRWPGILTVMVDASTYSAAEDFLVGLKGLEHVTVVGERTGGGSGRPRLIPLGPGCSLRISTALTYDRRGRPVEFHGIEPDEGSCGAGGTLSAGRVL